MVRRCVIVSVVLAALGLSAGCSDSTSSAPNVGTVNTPDAKAKAPAKRTPVERMRRV
jgi:hypothetical protein